MNLYLIRFFDGTFQSSPSGRVTNPELAACWRVVEAQKALEVAARMGGMAVLYQRDENQRLVPVVIQ